MKKILSLILSIALCVTLAACSSKPAGDIDAPSESATPSASLSPSPSTKPEPSTDTPAESEDPTDTLDEMQNAYIAALDNLIKNQLLPDGTKAELFGDIADNKFAIADVDNDGKDELLLMYSTTSMAGMVGYVFGYDETTKALTTELREFPLLTFYDNGTIEAGWSHNQGLAGDNFWPYTLYQYAPDSDSYEFVGMVDAWDKSYAEKDYENNPFPSELDTSGTGYVYYIMNDKEYDNSNPVDASVYDEWVSTHIGGAAELQIAYMDLTEENIAQIKNG